MNNEPDFWTVRNGLLIMLTIVVAVALLAVVFA